MEKCIYSATGVVENYEQDCISSSVYVFHRSDSYPRYYLNSSGGSEETTVIFETNRRNGQICASSGNFLKQIHSRL